MLLTSIIRNISLSTETDYKELVGDGIFRININFVDKNVAHIHTNIDKVNTEVYKSLDYLIVTEDDQKTIKYFITRGISYTNEVFVSTFSYSNSIEKNTTLINDILRKYNSIGTREKLKLDETFVFFCNDENDKEIQGTVMFYSIEKM